MRCRVNFVMLTLNSKINVSRCPADLFVPFDLLWHQHCVCRIVCQATKSETHRAQPAAGDSLFTREHTLRRMFSR
jgi:hypothetical protein